jgi:cobalt/nickel transport system ATP-binding protein
MNDPVEPRPVFSLNAVSYAYTQNVAALTDVSLCLRHGERVAILGANGSGKSTLIKMLDGLLFPQRGTFEAFGEPITEAAMRHEDFAHRFRRRVGFIFQNADAQLFSPTVREEIAFGPLQMALPIDQIQQRIADIAALMEIEKLLDRPPFQLSGGEKKKVAIASALVINPDVLLLDEPTNGLDPRSQHWLVALLQKLHVAGKTLVTATHDMAIVPEIANRALVFSEAHCLVADGPVADILKNTELLLRVNLIHEHWHRHGPLWHSHPHLHDRDHAHTHDGELS